MSRSIHENHREYRDASESSYSSEQTKQTLLRKIWDRIHQKRLHKRNTKRWRAAEKAGVPVSVHTSLSSKPQSDSTPDGRTPGDMTPSATGYGPLGGKHDDDSTQ